MAVSTPRDQGSGACGSAGEVLTPCSAQVCPKLQQLGCGLADLVRPEVASLAMVFSAPALAIPEERHPCPNTLDHGLWMLGPDHSTLLLQDGQASQKAAAQQQAERLMEQAFW